MALATSLGITGFMGYSLSLLATLKLMDLESFAKGFEKYDLITKKIRPYAKIYPFAELAIAFPHVYNFLDRNLILIDKGLQVQT